jgi:hypothetical protein
MVGTMRQEGFADNARKMNGRETVGELGKWRVVSGEKGWN